VKVGECGVEILVVAILLGVEVVVGEFSEEVGHHDGDLAVVTLGHLGVTGGATGGKRWGFAAKESVRSHGEEDVLVHALSDVKHASGGVEAEHGMLASESKVRLLEVHLEFEAMGGCGVGKEGRQADAIRDGEMIVDHANLRGHMYLTLADGETKVVVDFYGVTLREKVENGPIFGFIELLEEGKLEDANLGVVKLVEGGGIAVVGSTDDLVEDVGLVDGIFWISGERIGDDGDVGRAIWAVRAFGGFWSEGV
jgi:hypothetical protein